MSGILYLCATPIGNLQDMTFRVLDTLKEADLIAAEDTRESIRLLNHFGIHTPMTSYHEYNKTAKARTLVEAMLGGKNVACVTDAGTPGISDPGEVLVRMALDAGIKVIPVPGACAAVNALISSGLETRRFCFEAFLPAQKKERDEILAQLKEETRTIVLYEAPHRLVKTLTLLAETLGDRKLTVCRELTKKHEQIWRTTLLQAVSFYQEQEPRGEFALVIGGRDKGEMIREKQDRIRENLSLEDHMRQYLERGLSRKEAMKAVAKERGMAKRDVYRLLLEEDDEDDGIDGSDRAGGA
jgi:16S rRNA (cytidine1402-2'-O)-methyltransferase